MAIVWMLSGKGFPGPNCGIWTYHGCLNHSPLVYVKKRKFRCRDRNCPDCYLLWMKDEATTALRRIVQAMQQYKLKGISHVVLSPPQDSHFETVADYRQLRNWATSIARMVGYKGGTLIFHPWRCRYYDGEKAGGINLRREGTFAVIGPHFHAFLDGWNQNVETVYKDTGWVVKKVRFITSLKQIHDVLVYALEHSGIANIQSVFNTKTSIHALTWFGNMSYSTLKVPLRPDLEEEHCPHCDAPLSKLRYIGNLPEPPDIDEKSGSMQPGADWALDLGPIWEEVPGSIKMRTITAVGLLRDLIRRREASGA